MGERVVFNAKQLDESTDGSAELASQVIEIFICDTPGQVAELRQALTAKDFKTAERAAHSIKGSAAAVGGELLRDQAAQIEAECRGGNPDAANALIPLLEEQIDALQQAFVDAGY